MSSGFCLLAHAFRSLSEKTSSGSRLLAIQAIVELKAESKTVLRKSWFCRYVAILFSFLVVCCRGRLVVNSYHLDGFVGVVGICHECDTF